MNSMSPILELIIGVYTYGIFKIDGVVQGGLGGLDWAYFGRFILLAMTLYFAFSFMKSIVTRVFGGGIK